MADSTAPDVLGKEARIAVVGRTLNGAQQAIAQAEVTIAVNQAAIDRLEKDYPEEWRELQKRVAADGGDDESSGVVGPVAGDQNGVADQ